MLRIKEHDSEDGKPGRILELSDVEFTPLGFSDLKDAKLSKPMTIPLQGHGTIVVKIGDELPAQSGHFHTYLESHFTSKAIGLVRGGWLPSALAVTNETIVLPDRCIVAQLKARMQNGIVRDNLEKDFIDLFADSPVRINPMLFVLEGDARTNPTSNQALAQLNEAAAKLRAALPKAILVAADRNGLEGVLGLIEESNRGMTRKEDFLLRLAPSLMSPVGKRRLPSLWDEIVVAAKDYELPTSSLIVLAAMSSMLMPNGSSPAKGILKLHSGYTRADAYNALADLRALEILMCLFAIFPNQKLMLCTADKDLALFWAGLDASNFTIRERVVSANLTKANLFPGITDAQWHSLLSA